MERGGGGRRKERKGGVDWRMEEGIEGRDDDRGGRR